jgi:hypothetical protein
MAAENETAAPWKMPYPSSTGEVKKGATDIQELAERVTSVLKERLTTISEHGTSFTAASGELIKCTAAITVTLPSVAANATVGILANAHEIKVGSGSAKIYGDFVEGVTSITLVGYQHVVLVSDGTNWFILAGEPKREQVYSAQSISLGSEYYGNLATSEAPTRPALLSVEGLEPGEAEWRSELYVGGVALGAFGGAAGADARAWITFLVLPGVKFKFTTVTGSPKLRAATVPL